jgi:penicillin-binding protein 2
VVIGQGFNLVTPIQMLGLISAVANGGIRHKPLVIRRIEFPGGLPVKTQAPVSLGTLPASENTLRIVKKGLMDAVNKPTGTGWIARIAGVDVAGKTGTAQVVRMAEDDEDEPIESKLLRHRDHGWFIAFAPAEEPRIAVAVLIEHGGHGSTAAGPIAREMIKTYLEDLGSGGWNSGVMEYWSNGN